MACDTHGPCDAYPLCDPHPFATQPVPRRVAVLNRFQMPRFTADVDELLTGMRSIREVLAGEPHLSREPVDVG